MLKLAGRLDGSLTKILGCLVFLLSFLLNYYLTIRKNLFDFTNSDLLYSPLFSEDLKNLNLSVLQWDVPPAPYFFPDIFLSSLAHFFLNPFLFSFLPYSIFVTTTLYFLIRKIQPKINFEYSLLMLSILLSTFNFFPETLALFFFPTYHVSAFLLCLYFFSLKNEFRSRDLILLLFFSISDKILFSILFLPIGLILIWEKQYRQIVKLIFTTILIFIIIIVMEKLSFFHIPKIPILNEFKRILKEHRLLENFYLSLKQTNTEFKELCFFLIPSFILLIGNIAFSFQRRISLLILLSILIQILIQVIFGFSISFRYNWFLFLTPFIGLFFYFEFLKRSLWLLAIAILLIGILKFDFSIPENNFIACLLEKRELKHGISDYWNAKYIRFFTKNQIEVNSVTASISSYQWIQNREWLSKDKQGQNFNYQFILPERLSQEILFQKFGEPKQIEKCAEKEIWIYPNGILKL